MAEAERRRAFEALLQTHRKIVFKVAAVYARGEEDRRDLAQEILLGCAICVGWWRCCTATGVSPSRAASTSTA